MMDRRSFLSNAAKCSVGASLALPVIGCSSSANLKPTKENGTVSLATGKDVKQMVTEAVARLGGMGAFVKKGDNVVVKPNIGFPRTAPQAANTNPLVVKAVVELALDAGAAKVSVFDRPTKEPEKCYRLSGIAHSVGSINDPRVACYHLDPAGYVPIKIKNAQWLEEWTFHKDALEADVYINVPTAKHHGWSKVTMGLKNVMGVIGGKRFSIHYFVSKKLADLNMVIKPTLNVLDATRILMANGPQGGSVDDVKVFDTILAATDVVAMDAFATDHFFGIKPSDIGMIENSYNAGLGQMNLSKIDVLKA
jgi:uncharacterized protein (DUF362 family)